MYLIVDSTGLRLRGSRDTEIETQGATRRRFWSKFYIGQDAATEEIVCFDLTSAFAMGDMHTNAMAETINGLYESKLIERQTTWGAIQEVEPAELKWGDWFNTRRLSAPIGNITPKGAGPHCYAGIINPDMAA